MRCGIQCAVNGASVLGRRGRGTQDVCRDLAPALARDREPVAASLPSSAPAQTLTTDQAVTTHLITRAWISNQLHGYVSTFLASFLDTTLYSI